MFGTSATPSLSPSQAAQELLRRRGAKGSIEAYIDYQQLGFVPATHHRLLIGELEAVERGECPRLMVYMPPGSAKSTYASMIFPAWYLGRHPEGSVIAASHTGELAERFGRRVRNLECRHRADGLQVSKLPAAGSSRCVACQSRDDDPRYRFDERGCHGFRDHRSEFPRFGERRGLRSFARRLRWRHRGRLSSGRVPCGGCLRFRAWQQRARCRIAISNVVHPQSTRRQRPGDPAPASGIKRAAASWATEPLRLTPIVSPFKATAAPQAAATRFGHQARRSL